MNINCIICSDIMIPTAEIYSTTCGHMFHYICLIKWIERSRTCPQCRCKATLKSIHKIYFNLTNTEGITDDAVTLQAKMDCLNFQITLKDKDIKMYTEKNTKLKEQTSGLRQEVKDLEHKQSVLESAMHALKEQVSYFKLKAKDTERLNDEVNRLKNKLKDLEHVQLVIAGSREQVNDMLRYNKDPQSLNLLVFTLKKELSEADRKYKLLHTNIKHLQNDVSKYRKENSEITKENNILKSEVENHNTCAFEKQFLKNKITDLENKPNMPPLSNSNFDRMVLESPAPYKKKKSLELESPSLEQKVQAIKDSESPYLPVKSSNVGLSCLMNSKYTTSTQLQRSASGFVFKNRHPTLENVNRDRKSDFNYNGLGGHSKEHTFPTPKPIVGQKRSKSSTVSTKKFRTLAPNKKLDNFFTNSDE